MEKEYDFLQTDRFTKIGEGRYTIRSCNKKTYIEFTPETKRFDFVFIKMIKLKKIKDEIKDLEELEYLESKVKQVRLVAKLGKQGFH